MAGERRRYTIGAKKVPWRQRDLVHRVLEDPDDDRRYRDILGSNSTQSSSGNAQFPTGSHVAYSLELDDDEAAAFAAASNARYVEPDVEYRPARAVGRPTGAVAFPALSTLAWMRARYVDLRRWHGRDVPVAVLDQGTTAAARRAMGITLVARTVTSGVTLGPGQELVHPSHSHGCVVAPNAVPAGGLLLDCIISGDSGGAASSAIAAGVTWAVDNGAKVINISFAGAPNAPETQVMVDAATYARDRGVHIVASAGNDNTEGLAATAALSRTFPNVHSSIAFDEATDRRALFSNYAADASGCGPGVDVWSFDPLGNPVRWNGTSASAPHMTQLLARAMTGGTYTANQAGAAFKANTRNTGAPANEQGVGAYDLHRALTALGTVPAATASVGTPTHLDSRGGATSAASWALTPASGVAVDDLQLVVLVSSVDAKVVVPPGWTLLTDAAYHGGWEASRGITVGPTRCRVLAAPYTAAQPSSVSLSFGGGSWFSAMGIVTVRGAGGMDHERCAPVVRFGTGSSVTAVSTVPASTNDLQLCVFAQRHPTATTGTLSLPAGLTQRGFWRPSTGTTGYTLLVATRALTDATRTPEYVSTSNDTTGTWMGLTLTIPGGATPVTPVTQAEPAGPPGGATLFLPHS